MRRSIFALIVLIFVCSLANAETYYQCGIPQSHPRKIKYFHANGMLNTYKDASAAAYMTFLKLFDLYTSDKTPEFSVKDLPYLRMELLYNESEGLDKEGNIRFSIINELAEVARQWGVNSVVEIIRWFNGKMTDESEEKQSDFMQIVETSFARFEEIVDPDLQFQIAAYEKALKDGYFIMTGAHSQGNFYTKKVLELLKEFLRKNPVYQGRYKIISVGSPITLEEADAHLKDEHDLVAMLAIESDVNVYNTNIPKYWNEKGELVELSYHSYLTYLWGSDSGPMFDNFFINSLNSFEFPDVANTSGIIEVEITKPPSEFELDHSFSDDEEEESSSNELKLYVKESYLTVACRYAGYGYVSNDPVFFEDHPDVEEGLGHITKRGNKEVYTITCRDIEELGISDIENSSYNHVRQIIISFYVYNGTGKNQVLDFKITTPADDFGMTETTGKIEISSCYDSYRFAIAKEFGMVWLRSCFTSTYFDGERRYLGLKFDRISKSYLHPVSDDD